MRIFIALALYVSLTSGLFRQETRQTERPERKQIRRYLAEGKYGEAEQTLRAALTAEPAEIEAKTEFRIALTDLLREEGRDPERRALFTAILEHANLTWKQHIDALMGLAGINGHAGAIRISADEWMESVELAREHHDEILEANGQRGLAVAWLDAGNPSEAEPLLRRSMKLLEANGHAKPWDTGATLAAQGECYNAQDKTALAEDAWSRALVLYRGVFGEGHPQVAFIMERLAVLYAKRKEFDLARHYADYALGVMQSSCGADSMAAATALVVRGDIEVIAMAYERAAKEYGQALAIARKLPEGRVTSGTIMQRYAGILKVIHRGREAKALMAEAKTFRGKY